MQQLLLQSRTDRTGAPNSSPSGISTEERDVEMEDEIAEQIAKADALSDYDIDVTKEGEAITEYLALLDSVRSSKRASSSQ
ncbi:conserved hypothetical protein [Ricinus communis]|uniref:Uncharacterized protein n=1 Tax=Ricinus communis TaxID=3988 RepID=B9SMQ3_RICCO|nr:conserved hypothetical protein [Ricinus communis]